MKVLLVNPIPAGLMRINPPMGLGYMGASLKKSGHTVLSVDQVLGQDLEFNLREFGPDVVGITGISSQYNSMKEVASVSKKYGNTVVVGGIHPSALPDFVLNDCEDIDFVVKGEGEYSFTEFLSKGSPVGIPGLYYRNTGSVEGRLPEPIDNLDELPFPWEVLDPRNYFSDKPAGLVTRHLEVGNLLSSRGCPYGCSFCCASVVQGERIRLRSAENILDEVELLVKKYSVREIQIIDDNFSFYSEHVLAFCNGIKERRLEFDWTLTNGIRADRVDRGLLTKMKETGCYYFAIGIESGSERILKSVSKSLSLEAVKSTVKTANSLGFVTQGFFMVGFPGETKEDREASSKFASQLDLDRVCVAPVMALPGSKLFSTAYNDGLESIDWAQVSSVKNWKPMLGAPDYKTVKNFLKSMRLRFYLSPIRNIRHILKVRTWHQLRGMVQGFRGLFEY